MKNVFHGALGILMAPLLLLCVVCLLFGTLIYEGWTRAVDFGRLLSEGD